MNILASVYACSPYDGSERAVGWNWIVQLDKYHTITALTSHVYKKDIEDYLEKNPTALVNTKFVYIEVPNTAWHVGYRFERLYYILWQRYAMKIAKRLIKQEKYDLVHHITYVTCILPTYMHKLGLPFLYGPVSGGENTPAVINYPMSKKNKIMEMIRTGTQVFFTHTPNYYKTVKNAALILTTTEETKFLIPKKYRYKVEVFQSIGLAKDIFYPEPKVKHNKRVHFLIAGRMLYWKGFELAISAFLKALNNGCDIELTILGDTEKNPSYEAYRDSLKKLCGKNINERIHFVSSVPHSQMKEFYDRFDCLINCSLRDSGCFVVMEGMSRGLPVICVNAGGPRVNTTEKSAIKIEPAPMQDMVDKISEAIMNISIDQEKREKMGKAAREHAKKYFLMSKRMEQMNKFYEMVERKTYE